MHKQITADYEEEIDEKEMEELLAEEEAERLARQVTALESLNSNAEKIVGVIDNVTKAVSVLAEKEEKEAKIEINLLNIEKSLKELIAELKRPKTVEVERNMGLISKLIIK